jgi:ATP:cob(I)alamin adenosyltransferase
MRIYTRTGDEGKTSLWDGSRLEKADSLLDVCGTIDEAQAALGLARSFMPAALSGEAERLQAMMKEGMAFIARGSRECVLPDCKEMERKIDDLTARYPRGGGFVFPGPSPAGAAIHLSRGMIRRAERKAWDLLVAGKGEKETCVFLNRLSDCLFALAEAAEMEAFVDRVVRLLIKGGNGMKDEKLDLETAKCIADGCELEAKSIKVPMVIAVADETGRLVLLRRMDDSLPASLEIAQKKAKTAAALRMTTRELAGLVTPGRPLYGLASDETLCVFGGGIPIQSEGRVVGAVGVSGGTVEQDVAVAAAGLAALGKS